MHGGSSLGEPPSVGNTLAKKYHLYHRTSLISATDLEKKQTNQRVHGSGGQARRWCQYSFEMAPLAESLYGVRGYVSTGRLCRGREGGAKVSEPYTGLMFPCRQIFMFCTRYRKKCRVLLLQPVYAMRRREPPSSSRRDISESLSAEAAPSGGSLYSVCQSHGCVSTGNHAQVERRDKVSESKAELISLHTKSHA